MSPNTRFITHTALFLALAILVPVAFHSGPWGRAFLPMHIPVLLAGFLVGPVSGLLVGLLAPVVSQFLTGMPSGYAVPLMTMELAVYGLAAGLTYKRWRWNIYLALIVAMILGRFMFALGILLLGPMLGVPYDFTAYLAFGGPLWTGLPGIVVQLVLIPIIVAGVDRRRRP